MKQPFVIAVILIFACKISFAQQIPVGSCGIVYVHDAAGNRTKAFYYCNNGGPYPEKNIFDTSLTSNILTQAEISKDNATTNFQPVDALFPNPTSGIFYITFTKKLNEANIKLIDVNGRVVSQNNQSGIKITCDLSGYSKGVYFVIIEEKDFKITKKVIKL